MAKSSIFDRAQALRPGGGASRPATGEETAEPTSTSTAGRPALRRRGAAEEPPPVVVAAPEPPRRVVRRRGSEPEPAPPPVVVVAPRPAPAPAPVAPPEVAAAPQAVSVPVVIQAAAPVVAPAPPPPVALAPVVVEAVADDGSPPSIESLLSTPRRPKRHSVLSSDEVAAETANRGAPSPAPRIESIAAIEVDAPPVANEPVVVVVAAASAPPSNSLEDMLRDQGIVQHRPKKGRRIIEDDISRQIAAQPTGSALVRLPPPQAPAPPPPPGGVSLLSPEPRRNKPIRFLDPATLMRDPKAVPKKPARKSIVSRTDALYGAPNDRRRRKGGGKRGGSKTELTTPAAHKRVIKVDGTIAVSDLAHELGIKGGQLVKILVGMGQMVTVNERLDVETAQIIAEEFEFEVKDSSFNEEEIFEFDTEQIVEEDVEPRSPVVTIMGHVDHGKTTLLDSIRNAHVADGEAGGITQHISAFEVMNGDRRIVFIDTPGHEAFTAMRARGAQITDIVILVVAATDGVMPQTVEVINHAKAAGVPIIVAINKVDLPESNPEKVRNELSEHGLISEAWGGEVQMIEVSAKQKLGIDDLLEAITLQSELLELTANPNRSAQGHVVESQMEKGRGPVPTLLIQRGTLTVRDFVVAGFEYGKIRAMLSMDGKVLKTAGPSTPVQILGLSGLPFAGDEFGVVSSEADARKLVDHRRDTERRKREESSGLRMEDVFKRMQEGEIKELNLIVKADVQGSLEALRKVFGEIVVRDLKVRILHAAVGGITESDVSLADASGAIVLGFNVRPDKNARALADDKQVDVRTYRVIYEAVDEVKAALVGLLDPEFVERVQGHAEIRETIKIPKIGLIAGVSVQDGKIGRNHKARLLRDSVVVWEGSLGSLRRFKDDVKEVVQGYECGVGLDGYDDIKPGDIIETFIIEEIRPTV